MIKPYPASSGFRIALILLLLSAASISRLSAQQTTVTGDWVMGIDGLICEVKIEHIREKIVLWAKIGDDVFTLSGSLSPDSIKVTGDVPNNWTETRRECHEKILARIERYPQYRLLLKLKRTGDTWAGNYTAPVSISCEGEDATITMAQPRQATLRRVNAVYWSSGKEILKASTFDVENKSTLTTGNDRISYLALDQDASRVYWCEGKYIYSIRQDGSQKQTVTTAPEEVYSPYSIAIDHRNNKIFWIEDRKILSTFLGRDQRTTFIDEQRTPASLAIDRVNQKIYWLLPREGKIRRADLNGTHVEDFFSSTNITGIAIDAKNGFVYCTTPTTIQRLPITGQRMVETLVTDLTMPRDIVVDEIFEKIYWSQGGHISRANLDGKRPELRKMYAGGLGDIITGPMGPKKYEQTKITGQLLITESAPGKSLLQQLVKNDTYFQVMLAQSQRPDSAFNLTDARLVMIWGKNFPTITHRGTNVVINSRHPSIRYVEFNSWCDQLQEHQKQKYAQYPLWLAEGTGLVDRTWESALKVVKDSLGRTALDSIMRKERMLVVALPGMGVLPGMQSFTMNDAEAQWYLSNGSTTAAIRFVRRLPAGEEEPLSNLYSGDPFFIEIELEKEVNLDRIELSYFVNDQQIEVSAFEAVRLTDKKKYRTPQIKLNASTRNSPRAYAGLEGGKEISCKTGSVFKVAISNNAWFNNGSPTAAMGPLIDPEESIWHMHLGEAVGLRNLTFSESEWEAKSTERIETISNLAGSCEIKLGDYAAMLLLKKYFVRQMETYLKSLDENKDNPAFQYGFWETMAPNMSDPGFPLGDMEVTDDDVEFRNVFTREYILQHYPSPADAKKWIEGAKKDAFKKYLASIKKSLDAAKNTPDEDVEAMMNLTGFGFNAMVEQATSDLQKKEYAAEDDCGSSPYKWVPGPLERSFVKTMSNTAEHCKANEELQSAATDCILAGAGLLVFPIGAYMTYGRLVAAVYSAALGSGELVRDHFQFSAEDAEMDLASGSFAVLGTQRYTMAKLKVTPTWARMLSYFGGAAGILGDASDIVKNINRVDLDAAYRELPGLLKKVNDQGALKAFEAMSPADKSRFLLLLGEAESLKKLPLNELSDTQRKLVQTAEQFAEQIDEAARVKGAVGEAAAAGGQSVSALRQVLPEDLQKKVPVVRNDNLPGNTVHLEYELDSKGFVTNLKIIAGKTASAQHVAEHLPALNKMMEYQQVAGMAANLYQRIRYWYRRIFSGEPPIGSPAWEAMQEIQKLNFIIDNRLSRLSQKLDLADPAALGEEIQYLTRQLAEHQRAFEDFVTNPALGRGFVAAKASARRTLEASIEAMAEVKLKNADQLTVKAERLAKGMALLKRLENSPLYERILKVCLENGDDGTLASRLVEGVMHLEEITPQQLAGMRAFLVSVEDGGNTMAMILQRARLFDRTVEGVKLETGDILNEMSRLAENADALKGMDAFIKLLDPNDVSTVSRLAEFISDRRTASMVTDHDPVASIFETIHEFRNHNNFRKVLKNLSKKDDGFTVWEEAVEFTEGFSVKGYRGAVGQLCAARDLVKKHGFKPAQIFFELEIGDEFRFVDILVKDGNKILMLVECKEYARLDGLLKPDITRQFVKDVLIANKNGLTVRNGVRWMISQEARNAGSAALLLRVKKEFLKALDNDAMLKDLCCKLKIDRRRIPNIKANAKSDFSNYFEEILQFF